MILPGGYHYQEATNSGLICGPIMPRFTPVLPCPSRKLHPASKRGAKRLRSAGSRGGGSAEQTGLAARVTC